jgi:tetratricopeptide (TPR) repeat protein
MMNRIQGFLRDRGDAARDQRDWSTAVRYYGLYLSLRPNDHGIQVQRGHALKELGEFSNALEAYQAALKLAPADVDLHLQIGHLHKVSGHPRLALAWYLKSLRIDPKFSEAIGELGPYSCALDLSLPHQSRSKVPNEDDPLFDRERDRQRNFADAALEPESVTRSKRVIEEFQGRLHGLGWTAAVGEVPRLFHFTHGFEQAGDIPYYGYIAIRSALHFNPGWSAVLYCHAEPVGPNWERLRSQVQAVTVPEFEYFGQTRIFHPTHKAEIVRLIAMNELGGVYLDLDTLTTKPYVDLLGVDFCMGVQPAGWNSAAGLTDAVLIGQPQAEFSTEWLKWYDSFRSIGHDGLWDQHALKVPTLLSQQAPESIRVLSDRAFSAPVWYMTKPVILSEDGQKFRESLQESYCLRLWGDYNSKLLRGIDEEFVRSSRSIYADYARRIGD